jgi:hypothetical protein
MSHIGFDHQKWTQAAAIDNQGKIIREMRVLNDSSSLKGFLNRVADVGSDTEFVGNPVTIRTTDGRSYSAHVDIPRGDPALPLTDDELLTKYRDCARSQLRPDDMERSVGLVLGFEKVADIGTLMATLSSPLREA